MIDDKQLMKGSYIRTMSGQVGRVTEIHNERVNVIGLDTGNGVIAPFSCFYPLPITPEILLRLGFVEYDPFVFSMPAYRDHLSDYFIYRAKKNAIRFDCSYFRCPHRVVEHVHQLQRIAHVVTGEMLTIGGEA